MVKPLKSGISERDVRLESPVVSSNSRILEFRYAESGDLLPNQAHYQAVPHPVTCFDSIAQFVWFVKPFLKKPQISGKKDFENATDEKKYKKDGQTVLFTWVNNFLPAVGNMPVCNRKRDRCMYFFSCAPNCL